MQIDLNQRALSLCADILRREKHLHVAAHTLNCGTRLIDFGIEVPGGQEAGVMLARVCLADLAQVEVASSDQFAATHLQVCVSTDQPVAACMASQYAGWEVKVEDFFAMGSGPMRAAAGRELLFDDIGYREQPTACVGVLESAKLPTEEVCRDLASKCSIEPEQLTLLVAPASSIAGTLQVVARSVETCLHKLHELGFDLSRIVSGQGSAPLPPVAEDDLAGIGVTNDAILYGGAVTLGVRGDNRSLEEIGPRIPSSASADYGRPFAEVLARYNHDFYQIDPMLFSPALVRIENLDTSNSFSFGKLNHEILSCSFKT